MPDYFSFHPDIASAYSAVHEWLAKQQQALGYKNISHQQAGKLLSEKTLKSAAAQYNVFFHAHYFKVIYTLENIITSEKLLDWIDTNQHICLIDIGCGAGAATIAFLERIICLRESEQFTNSLEILCIGIDINYESLTIYNQLMVKVRNLLEKLNIKLTYTTSGKSLQELAVSLISFINKQCSQWEKPCLSDAILLQSNVVSGFKASFDSFQKNYNNLQELGVSLDEIIDSKDEFGIDEARAYKWLAQDAKIDNLHIITVGTKDYSLSVIKIADSIKLVFDESGHIIEQYNESDCKIGYENPLNSYWRDRGKRIYSKESNKGFNVNFSTITNAELKKDKDWEKLIDLKNLEMAWVRARKYLKSESLPDEIEYRLFEINLYENLQRLQQDLKVYIKEVVNSEDNLDYKFPKNESQSRPRSLSRLEGEILSTAIIQKFGKKASLLHGNSYAYRVSVSNRDTEYLYNPWFTLYRDFLAEARKIAKQEENRNGVIICVDIESFYTRIIQDDLIELGKELTQSERILWLLKILLSKNLDDHEIGKGITQGSIGSGFYANLYLTPIDVEFRIQAKENDWGVKLIRYVDDIILFIPNKNDVEKVLEVLTKELEKLGLKLNESKTERYDNVSEFIETLEENKLLDELDYKFNEIVNPLWICNHRYRKEFIEAGKRDNDNQWWYLIKIYQKCLRSIQIYIDAPELSRRIDRYLWSERKRKAELKEKPELKLPILVDDINDEEIQNWAIVFQNCNSDWIEKKNILREELIKLFLDSW
ncbi:MAG: RNA-directed DNA polymerase, partial [Okeania sp. SIO2F4]|uniref:RNA-directed DNA polymerase n=1 Tax=Okeania sp. SIO2F4 TaxID=2607790 RepID=UPI00142977D4